MTEVEVVEFYSVQLILTRFYFFLNPIKIMKKILLLTCCWLVAFSLHAQQRTVTGKVTDSSDGSPLPGVSILVKGTNNGTTSDVNGTYSISVDADATLVFSFIGFESQETIVGERTAIEITLAASASQLQEVVVIGYGE